MSAAAISTHTRTGDFYGLPTRALVSPHLRVEFLTETGPRLVRLQLTGAAENLLAETPEVSWETSFGRYFLRGGHRLWRAPESELSSTPDNEPVQVLELPDGVTLQQNPEPTGLGKRLTVQLLPQQPSLRITHELFNEGAAPLGIAPWAITQLPLGGTVILPQPVSAVGDLLPNRHLVLWPYASWRDPRLQVHDDYLLVAAEARQPPLKIGYLNTLGWAAYWRAGVLFVKRFTPQLSQLHPDRNSNVEVYCNEVLVELETLAPLHMLLPGQAATHVEQWDLYRGVSALQTLAEVQVVIPSLGLQALVDT